MEFFNLAFLPYPAIPSKRSKSPQRLNRTKLLFWGNHGMKCPSTLEIVLPLASERSIWSMAFRKAVPIFFVHFWKNFVFATLTNWATSATAPTLVIATHWMHIITPAPSRIVTSWPATSTPSENHLLGVNPSPRLFPFSVFHRIIRSGRVSRLQTRKKSLNRPLIAHVIVTGATRLLGAGPFKHIPIANNPCAEIQAAAGCGRVIKKPWWSPFMYDNYVVCLAGADCRICLRGALWCLNSASIARQGPDRLRWCLTENASWSLPIWDSLADWWWGWDETDGSVYPYKWISIFLSAAEGWWTLEWSSLKNFSCKVTRWTWMITRICKKKAALPKRVESVNNARL